MKRYELENIGVRDDNFAMMENADGDFVKFEDVEVLLAELNLLRSQAANRPEGREQEGWKLVPVKATEEMMKAGAAHEWSGGYDRNGSHASGKYEEYTEGLRHVFGDHSSPFAASEVYEAMVAAAPEMKK